MKSVQGLKPFHYMFQGTASEAYVYWHDVINCFFVFVFCLDRWIAPEEKGNSLTIGLLWMISSLNSDNRMLVMEVVIVILSFIQVNTKSTDTLSQIGNLHFTYQSILKG